MSNRDLLDISWGSVLKIFLASLIFYLIFLVRDIVIWFIFALIISVLLNPAINVFRRFKVPRILAVIFVYLAIFGILGIVIYLTAPIFSSEIKQFYQNFPQYLEKISPIFKEFGIETLESSKTFTKVLIEKLEQISGGFFSALAFFFGGILSTLFILITAFFLSLEEKGTERVLILFSPKRYEEYVLNLFKRCQVKISGWFGARILACLFVGIATFVILLFFKIKYSFTLGLLAGVLNFVPYLGPLATGFLFFLLIISTSTLLDAILVIIAFSLIQQIEGSILTPILSKKFVGVPPAIVLLALVIGAKLFGLLGAIFAVPVAGILYEFLKNFLEKRKEKETAVL